MVRKMALGVEKRLHPRIPVNWPVVMVTANGSIEGEIINISVGGAFIRYSEEADLNGDLQIVLKPSQQRSIPVTGRKVWSGNFNIDGKSVFSGVGIRFTEILHEDREFITFLASAYRNRHLDSPQTECYPR
jgi:hypothetical protein